MDAMDEVRDRVVAAAQDCGEIEIVPVGETLELRLLELTACILVVGLLTGMAVQYFDTGELLVMNHKTILSLATFVIVVILLAVRRKTGLRGRKAARVVLVAYLLLTLAYPGVKFVTDVLIS